MTTKILIDSVDKVKNFVGIMAKCPFDANLISGNHTINAKSLMGIFTLDTSKPVDLEICDDSEVGRDMLDMFKQYVVA